MNTTPTFNRGPFSRFIEEANRPSSEGVFSHRRPPHSPPTKSVADPIKLAAFLREEQQAQQKRWKRSGRQTMAWALVCSALPLLIILLRYLFFS